MGGNVQREKVKEPWTDPCKTRVYIYLVISLGGSKKLKTKNEVSVCGIMNVKEREGWRRRK